MFILIFHVKSSLPAGPGPMTYILVQVQHMKQEQLKNTGGKNLKAEQSFSKAFFFSFRFGQIPQSFKEGKEEQDGGRIWQSQICCGHLTTKDLGVRGAAAATCGPVPIEQSAGSGGVLQSKKELLSS